MEEDIALVAPAFEPETRDELREAVEAHAQGRLPGPILAKGQYWAADGADLRERFPKLGCLV